jgi:transforming growth factor-beta-induced protein
MIRLMTLCMLLLSSTLVLAQPGKGRGGPPPGVVPGDDTIAEIVTAAATAEEDAEFRLLLAAILYIAETNPESDLIAGLFDEDQYTVFAPNDQAFLALVGALAGDLDPEIITNDGVFAAIDDFLGEGTVEAVVSYHVTEGRRASVSVLPRRGERTIETLLEGATFGVDKDGNITAVGNSAEIVATDTPASNGVIHEIDTVILPVSLD